MCKLKAKTDAYQSSGVVASGSLDRPVAAAAVFIALFTFARRHRGEEGGKVWPEALAAGERFLGSTFGLAVASYGSSAMVKEVVLLKKCLATYHKHLSSSSELNQVRDEDG